MRRVARESVFKLLFEYSFLGNDNDFESCSLELVLLSADLSDDDREYIKRTYEGASAHFEEIKKIIADNLDNYTVERLYRPDFVTLALAVYELKFADGETPAKVVINEAVELAKRYGTEKSGGFVNGVLAKIAKLA